MFVRFAQAVIAIAALLAVGLKPVKAGPVLLYDTNGDRVLYSEAADQPWYAASLTKMMTAYLVFEAWRDGRANKDAKITISAKANAQPKMRLGFGAGKEITYDDAMKALIIVSANDIAYALAEAVSGSEEAFVAEMNAKAIKLGLTGTRYINPHGLPGEGQHTTAQDLARLASALLRDFPEHMPYFGLTTTEVGKMKKYIATHNPVLVTFDGGDGFKTGFTCSAGYNIVASASRDGHRLIAIVLGEDKPAKRAAKTNALLEHGFKWLAWKALFPAATIHSMPPEFYDREKVISANLDQRLKDCQDPIPTLEQIAKVAKKDPKKAAVLQAKLDAALAADAAEGGQAPAVVATGSLTPVVASTTPASATPAAAPVQAVVHAKVPASVALPAAPATVPSAKPAVAAAQPATSPHAEGVSSTRAATATNPPAKPKPVVASTIGPAGEAAKVKPKVSVKVGLKRQPPAKRSEADGVPFTFSP